jgi:hypothetical protein
MPYPPVTQFEARRLAPLRVVADRAFARSLHDEGFHVAAHAGDPVSTARAHRPAVVVTADPHAARTIRQTLPFVGLVLITDEPGHAAAILGNGVDGVGYVVDERRLADTVTRVARGESVLAPEVIAALVQARTRPSAPMSHRPSSWGSASHARASARPRSTSALANSGAKKR